MNKALFGIIAVSMVAILAVSFVSAAGFGNCNGEGLMNQELTEEQKTELQEQKQAMQTAIEDEDFDTWKSLVQNRIQKMQDSLTEENFNKLIEWHQEKQEMSQQKEEFKAKMQEAKQSGNYEQMKEFKEEFGEGSGLMYKFKARMRNSFRNFFNKGG